MMNRDNLTKVVRLFALVFGFTCVAIGAIGIFVPLLPATPFFLMAAWLFLNCSKKAHDWLQRQPVIGVALRDWESRRSISTKTKIIAISMILLSVATMALQEMPPHPTLRLVVFIILGSAALFIVTRPTD